MPKRLRLVFPPVWLLFLLPLLARALLFFHFIQISSLDDQWMILEWVISIFNHIVLFIFVALIWRLAGSLADAAHLSERGKERFMVMSTLGALTPPLSIAITEHTSWGGFSLMLVMLMIAFNLFFTVLKRSKTRTFIILSLFILQFCLAYLPMIYELSNNSYVHQIPLIPGSGTTLTFTTTVTLILAAIGLLVVIGGFLLSLRWQHPILMQLRKLTSITFIMGGCIGVLSICVFVLQGTSSIFEGIVSSLAAIVLPLLLAAFFTLPYLISQYYRQQIQTKEENTGKTKKFIVLHIGMLIVIAVYFLGQVYSYVLFIYR